MAETGWRSQMWDNGSQNASNEHLSPTQGGEITAKRLRLGTGNS